MNVRKANHFIAEGELQFQWYAEKAGGTWQSVIWQSSQAPARSSNANRCLAPWQR